MTISDAGRSGPVVSVLMPTYRQAAFLPRALRSLTSQLLTRWELIVVDDGSDDETAAIVAALADERIRFVRHPRNQGLGAALNHATRLATGRYLAYLPSDDVYDQAHLSTAVALLSQRPDVYAAYSGIRWYRSFPERPLRRLSATATLRDDVVPGSERSILCEESEEFLSTLEVRSGNPFALVQVVHRRGLESEVRWRERHELVSDTLEVDFWRALMRGGAVFAHTGAVTCEWGDHPDQRHKIIGGRGVHPTDPMGYHHGISRYRQYYQVPAGALLNWAPATGGLTVRESQRFAGLGGRLRPVDRDGMRILLVGALGFNPERILALEEHGHTLAGLWVWEPHFFDTASTLPFGAVRSITPDAGWREAVRDFRPDIIYGLLNWHAVPLVHEVLQARLGVPLVFHFKESPMAAMQLGLWPKLRRIVLEADGRIFLSEENRDWFEAALGGPGLDRTLLLDGDPPAAHWMTDDWSPKLSDQDGEIHTVCAGRVYLEPLRDLANAKIHVHLYSKRHARWARHWLDGAQSSRYLHVHDAVDPADWVRELSRYDAAWLHIFSSGNEGEILKAHWNDLNIPARLGTYAFAGLPLIMRRNSGHRVTVERIAQGAGVGLAYENCEELAGLLRAEIRDRAGTRAMKAARSTFSFDHHVDRLTAFFASVIDGRRRSAEPVAPQAGR